MSATMPAPALADPTVREAVDAFKTLLRFDTTNPPGNERPAIDWIAGRLRDAGAEPTVLESAPGRANLVARIKGGSKPALILTGHVDVVPAERDEWSVDPFAAIERDGWIYGRGAIDMKHHVAMSLTVFCELLRRKVTLDRDVIFIAVCDEEMGCRHGMRWLCEQHGDLLDGAGFGLNEFGGFPVYLPGGRKAYMVQIAERGFAWLRLRARGLPGHSSLPPEDSAVARIAEVVHRLATTRLPYRITPQAVAFVDGLGRAMGPVGAVTRLLKRETLEPLVLRIFPDAEQSRVMIASLHNTAVPTVIRAGHKTNVLPTEAIVEVDGRYLPGVTEAQFIDEVRAVVGPDIDIERIEGGPPATAPLDTSLFRTIEDVIAQRTNGAPVVPNITPGFTDSKWLARLGIHMYGFSPLEMPRDVKFSKLVHGHDERLPVSGFKWGVETLWQTVSQFCAV